MVAEIRKDHSMKKLLAGPQHSLRTLLAVPAGTSSAQESPDIMLLHGIPGVTVDVAVDGAVVIRGLRARRHAGPERVRRPDAHEPRGPPAGTEDVAIGPVPSFEVPPRAAGPSLPTSTPRAPRRSPPFENDTSAAADGQGRLTVATPPRRRPSTSCSVTPARSRTCRTRDEASLELPAGEIAGAQVAPTGGDPIADVPTVTVGSPARTWSCTPSARSSRRDVHLLHPGRALVSPLAELLGPADSAIPEAVDPRPAPQTVFSNVIDLSEFPVRPVGLEPDGELEIPNETEIGWYRYGATPGQPGATVLAAHVTWNRTIGPFFRLGDFEPGDRLEITLDDGTSRAYEVIERTMYPKDGLPRERIWRTSGDETLVLITCGGGFNRSIRRFDSNIVVYAVPIAHSDVTEAR
jgi:hypothetical protein